MKMSSRAIVEGLGEIERYLIILEAIPTIKVIIDTGGKWSDIKDICEPLGLDDSDFRNRPTANDYLLRSSFWVKKGRDLISDIQFSLMEELNFE